MAKLTVLVANRDHYRDMEALDHGISSNYAYRMVINNDKNASSYSFQRVKLPREAHLNYTRDIERLKQSWYEASLVYVGLLDEIVVAYAVVDAKNMPGTTRITDLVVMPELRQKGIGKVMVAAVESWAAKNSSQRVLLEIAMRNYPMVEMAKRAGYEMCGFMEDYFPNGDPALFYHKKLA